MVKLLGGIIVVGKGLGLMGLHTQSFDMTHTDYIFLFFLTVLSGILITANGNRGECMIADVLFCHVIR